MDDNGNCELITTLASVIREVDGSHSLGAAALAEALIARGVTVSSPTSRVYAAATLLSDGTVEPISASFSTLAEAEQDLAILRGDDYYRDRRPFIATSQVPHWRPVEAAFLHGTRTARSRRAEEIQLHPGCVPSGCPCDCHKPGMHVSHVVACCDGSQTSPTDYDDDPLVPDSFLRHNDLT